MFWKSTAPRAALRTPKSPQALQAHDPSLIELVITCSNCGHILNAFVSLAEMSVVPNPEEETSHG